MVYIVMNSHSRHNIRAMLPLVQYGAWATRMLTWSWLSWRMSCQLRSTAVTPLDWKWTLQLRAQLCRS